MGPITEHHLMLFLIQFSLLLGLCKLFGYIFEKLKQSSVTAEILVGVILGPAILGKFAPTIHAAIFPDNAIQRSMLETIAWFGNFFLLMETGLEINLSRVWQQRGEAIKLSMVDLILPIVICFFPIFFLPSHYLNDPSQRSLFALFIAAIMTISALPVAIRGLKDLNILKSDMGFLIISALTLNDIVGWVLFTIILGLFAHGSFELGFVSRLIVLTLAFTIISLTLFRKLVDKAITFIHEKAGEGTGLKITFIMIVGAMMGAITLKIGIHSLFGFFIAGTILGEAKHISEQDRFVMNRLVYSIFVPIFFANIGLHLDFIANFDLFLVLLISVIGILARYAGAYLGAIWAKQDRANINIIAISHTPGGQMHIVVAMLAYSSGLISETVLVSIICAAIISTVVFGPSLSFAVSKLKRSTIPIVFSVNDVYINVEANSQIELLKYISNIAAVKLGIDEASIFREVIQREDQMSTAMGRGIAIPHARIEGISKSHLFVFRTHLGLDWDSPDGSQVHLVFLTITPKQSPNAQIQILQSLAGLLQSRKTASILVNSIDQHILWDAVNTTIQTCKLCVLS